MTTPRHMLIKQRREQLGIAKTELARRVGLSTSEYWDVELYDDELTLGISLESVRSIAEILGFGLETLLGVGPPVSGQKAGGKPRHVILAEARQRLGVSRSRMIEDIGFDEAFVNRIENDSRALESYPYDVLRIVANYLKLDPADVVYAPSQ